MNIRRRLYVCPNLDAQADHVTARRVTAERHETDDYTEANLIGSRIVGTNELHAPVIDLDFPCSLVPSTTPGHFHLYIDKVLTWEQYEGLLRALGTAGIIEPGYMDASIARGQTFVRRPGVEKPQGANDSAAPDPPSKPLGGISPGHDRIDY